MDFWQKFAVFWSIEEAVMHRLAMVCAVAVVLTIMAASALSQPRLDMDRSNLGHYRWTDSETGVVCYVMPNRALDCLPISDTLLGGGE